MPDFIIEDGRALYLPDDCYDTLPASAEEREIADTHRYRMMGNAVSVPVAEWIAHRLKEALS